MNAGPPSWIDETSDGAVLRILAQPKSSRTEIVGLHGEPPRLKVKIAAPPVEGEANEELLRFLKKTLHLPGLRLELLRGSTSKTKDVLCRGVSMSALEHRLQVLLLKPGTERPR